MKKPLLLLALLAGILGLSSLACDTSSVSIAAKPAAAQTPGQMLYQDNFSDPNSGWDVWEDNISSAAYSDGGLRVVVNKAQYDFWSRPGKRFVNARIAVEAAQQGGPDNNYFGILCRFKDRDNFYALVISSDGYAGILKVKEGQYQVLGTPSLQATPVIRGKNDQLHLGRLRGRSPDTVCKRHPAAGNPRW